MQDQVAVRDGVESRDGRFAPDSYQPTAEYTDHLNSWANALQRNGLGAADLTNPETVPESRNVAHELASQSTVAETIYTVASRRALESKGRIANVVLAINHPAINEQTKQMLTRLTTDDHLSESAYTRIAAAARRLADFRQLPMTREIRDDPAFIKEYGFPVSEKPLQALGDIERQIATPTNARTAPQRSSDMRIAHRPQAAYMAYCSQGLERLGAVLRRRGQTWNALRDATAQGSAAMAAEPYTTSHIHRTQQEVIALYKAESDRRIQRLSDLTNIVETRLAIRYEQTRFDIQHGHDVSALYRCWDEPLTRILPLYE